MAIISFFVQAQPKKLFREVAYKVNTGETKRNFLGFTKNIQRTEYNNEFVGYSDSEIDGCILAKDIEEAINLYIDQGYELVTIIPITSGLYNSKVNVDNRGSSISGGNGYSYCSQTYAYGYGYSYTEGVNIIMKK